MKRPLFAIFSALTVSSLAADPVLPVQPGDLLKALPVKPESATLTRSEAETTFVEWYATRATRVFEFKANPPAQEAGSVEVSVTDTGGFRSSIAAFANFKPGKIEAVEKLFLGSIPVIQFDDPAGQRFLQALVSDRYIVEVTASGSQKDPAQWLRALHFQGLPTKASSAVAKPIRQAQLAYIDELKPANNRTHSVNVTDATALNKKLRTLPQLPEAPAR